MGNLLGKSVTKCSAENIVLAATSNNQLLGYGYDAAGNMTSDSTDGVTATYDAENRISAATRNSATTTYTYDEGGNRVKKTSNGMGTLYWYMTPGIVGESDLSGNLKPNTYSLMASALREEIIPVTPSPTTSPTT